MHDVLLRTYGPQHWWPAQSAFEVVVGAYLTQNTSWKAVERSLDNLRASGVLSIEGVRVTSIEQLRKLIRPSGFHTRKASALKAFVELLDRDYSGSLDVMASVPIETVRGYLLQLPGVGPETADAILLYALGHSVPVADQYLSRLAERHHLIELPLARGRRGYHTLALLTQEAFSGDVDRDRQYLYGEFHALTVELGKAHCRKIAQCKGCPLEPDLANLPKGGPSHKT